MTFLKSHKFKHYLLYTLGEISLVVIGILIALQINNWNDYRKNQKVKDFYIKALINDLRKDTIEISSIMRWEEYDLIQTERIHKKLNQLKYSSLDSIIFVAQDEYISDYYVKRSYNDKTFNTLVSSGNLEILDQSLIDRLMELSKLQQDELMRSESNLNIFKEYYIQYKKTLATYPTFKNDHSVLKNPIDKWDFYGLFISLLESREFAFRNTLSGQSDVKEQSEEILKILDSLQLH